MAGLNLGNAYMSISPSFKGFAAAVNKELGGSLEKTGATAGASFQTGFMGKLAGAGTAILGALGLASFITEATQASDATDKFKQTLNFAGIKTDKIDALTKSTQTYADQTVYDLADIQNMTAQLGANGVKDFDKIAEAAGNLNAVSGGNAETFKLVGLAITQVAGSGRLMTQDWNQIASAIPGASGKLQEAMRKNGAFTGNFREAMSKGQITAEEFNQALMDLGMTDVAKKAATSTSTIEGAWGNFQATVVGGLKSFIDWAKPALTGMLSAASTAFQSFFSFMSGSVIPALQSFGQWVAQNRAVLTPLAAAVAGAVVAWKAWKVAVGLWNTVTAISTGLMAGYTAAVEGSTIAEGLSTKAKQVAIVTQRLFNAAMNANPIMLVVTAIAALVAGLVVFFTQTEVGRQAWASFTGWLSTAWNVVSSAWSAAWAAIGSFLSGTWRGIQSVATGVWNAIVGFFKGIPGRVRGALSALGSLASSVGGWFGRAKDAAVERFDSLVGWVRGVPGRVVSALGNVGSLLWDAGSRIISSLWDGLKSKFESVKSWVSGIGDWIADHKGPKAYDLQLLVPNGQWIMGGLAEGLESSFHDQVLGTVSSMGPRLADELQTAASSNLSSSISAASSSSAASVVSASVSSSDVEAMAERIAERTANALYQAMTGSSRSLSLQSKAGVVI
jgi:tape measure domain-containing protein